MIRSIPTARWIGPSATMSCMVEQFGLAIRPWWRSRAWGLTSETTSGTSGSRRNADELSITVASAATKRGAHSREVAAPAENRAMSKPSMSAPGSRARTVSPPSSWRPAERAEAKATISSAANRRARSSSSMVVPTTPVAPTTAMRMASEPPG